MNYYVTFFVWKLKFISMIFLNFLHEEQCTVVHLPLVLMEICFFAISVDIHHELSEKP